MTSEISNKTYFLISIKGNKYRITEEQKEAIEKADLDHLIQLEEGSLKMHQVAEIISIEGYYHNHPKERPSPEIGRKIYTEEEFKQAKEDTENRMKPLTRNRYINASESMLRGLQKYIRESDNPSEWSLKAEKKLKIRIENAKNGIGGFAKSQIELINQLT